MRSHRVGEIIRQRKDAFRFYQALSAPRVLTSDGEAIAGSSDVRLSQLVLVGLPGSVGTVEGEGPLTQAGLALLTRIGDWPGVQHCLLFEKP